MRTEQVLHRATGVSVSVPLGWEVRQDLHPDVALLAVEPPREAGGFRANIVLTVGDTGGLSFRDWQSGTDEILPRTLADYLLVDLEKLPAGDRPGGRRLAHHATPDGVAVTMEQWFTQAGNLGYTLTATVDTWRYDVLADDLAELGRSMRLPGADA